MSTVKPDEKIFNKNDKTQDISFRSVECDELLLNKDNFEMLKMGEGNGEITTSAYNVNAAGSRNTTATQSNDSMGLNETSQDVPLRKKSHLKASKHSRSRSEDLRHLNRRIMSVTYGNRIRHKKSNNCGFSHFSPHLSFGDMVRCLAVFHIEQNQCS